MSDELAVLDAISQAELARRGDLTPLELVNAAIARIEALNPAPMHGFIRAAPFAAYTLPFYLTGQPAVFA